MKFKVAAIIPHASSGTVLVKFVPADDQAIGDVVLSYPEGGKVTYHPEELMYDERTKLPVKVMVAKDTLVDAYQPDGEIEFTMHKEYEVSVKAA